MMELFKTICKALLFLILGLLALVVSGAFSNNAVIRYLITTALTLILLFAFSHQEKIGLGQYGLNINHIFIYYLSGLLWGIAALIAAYITFCFQVGGKIDFHLDQLPITIIITILLATPFQSFSEEVWMRTFIPVKLNERFSKFHSALFCGFLFGVLHLLNPHFTLLGVLNGIILGTLLTIIFFDTRSVWLISGWHCGWNSFYGFFKSGMVTLTANGQTISISDLESRFATTIVIVICFFLWRLVCKYLQGTRNLTQSSDTCLSPGAD